MIHEVDAALRSLISDEALRDSGIEVALEAPTREWSARRTAPTVNAYLFDVREDAALRMMGNSAVRGTGGVVTKYRRPPRWYRLSYLVTAWTARAEDEHRLLSAVLAGLARHETIPDERLGQVLHQAHEPVPLTVGVRGEDSRSASELWTALGGQLKPSLEVVVRAPFLVELDVPAAPPAATLHVRAQGTDGENVDEEAVGPRGPRARAEQARLRDALEEIGQRGGEDRAGEDGPTTDGARGER